MAKKTRSAASGGRKPPSPPSSKLADLHPATRVFASPMQEELAIAIAANVKHWREHLGWTQEYLGERVSLSRVAVCEIEAGRRKISAIELHAFARVYCTLPMVLLSLTLYDWTNQ